MTKEDFIDTLEDYLIQYKNASCLAGRDSDSFIDKMYSTFIKDSPANINHWLKAQMSDRFLYASQPPKWTKKGERDWLYLDDEPMIFLHQFSLGLNEAKNMRRQFPVGETIFVFGGKKQVNQDTWHAIYKMVGQDNAEGYRVSINCA